MMMVAIRSLAIMRLIFIFSVSFGPCLVIGQFVSSGVCPEPSTMGRIDIAKLWNGRWYEVEKYPFILETLTGSSCLSEEYFQPKHNTTEYKSEFSVMHGRRHFLMPVTTTFGGRVPDGRTGISSISITQSPIPFIFRVPFLILGTDYKNHLIKWGCIQFGPLNYQYMFIYSRYKSLSDAMRTDVHRFLKKLGIPTKMLLITDQSGCPDPGNINH